MPASSTFYTDRIAQLELQIAAYEAAILAFASAGAQLEYTYDTGQDKIRVERADPMVMQDLLDAMINQREVYCVRIGSSSGAHTARPSP